MSVFRRRIWLFAVIMLIVLVGCRGDEPGATAWSLQWEGLVSILPELADIGSPPDQTLCRDTLGRLRETRAEMDPAPNAAITELVNKWVAVAEAAFFGCPPESEDITSFDQAYQELARIEESLTTALADLD